jgi:hypothetical protein
LRESVAEFIHGKPMENSVRKHIPTAEAVLERKKAVGSNLTRHFSQMGARVKFLEGVPEEGPRWRTRMQEEEPRIVLDIRRDRAGEYFEIRTAPGTDQEIVVLNVEPRGKHLLLLSRQFGEQGQVLAKQKFLCGHDERRWFVAAIPESEPVSTVAGAKIALKPEQVRTREEAMGVSRKESFRRKNAAFIRQGEWFFIPEAGIEADLMRILKNEPLSRGNGGKPHWAEECYRSGGETVYVSAKYPRGLVASEYKRLPEDERKHGMFRTMQRDAVVYVRGEIRHADHATVTLNGWHRVLMNTENRSRAMRFVAFLD